MVNEPSFVLNKSNGGMNWGFCQDVKEVPALNYLAILETSALAGSETK